MPHLQIFNLNPGGVQIDETIKRYQLRSLHLHQSG